MKLNSDLFCIFNEDVHAFTGLEGNSVVIFLAEVQCLVLWGGKTLNKPPRTVNSMFRVPDGAAASAL